MYTIYIYMYLKRERERERERKREREREREGGEKVTAPEDTPLEDFFPRAIQS